MTNEEKIKSMNTDELIQFIRRCHCNNTCAYYSICDGVANCNAGIELWLRSEVK